MPDSEKADILEYAGKILLAVAASYVFGKVGQLMATPPIYATILWPPSGIALGMMLAYGVRMWPGVFIAAVFLNSPLIEYLLHGKDFTKQDVWASLLMSMGATLQALLANAIIRRFFPLPIAIQRLRDAAFLTVLAGPVGCIVSPSVGIFTLHLFALAPAGTLPLNWLTWWAGDTFGVFVFMPLTLLCTGTLRRVFSIRHETRLFPTVALVTLLIPLCVTLVAWKHASSRATEKSQAQFQHFALESERALLYRMDSYEKSLLSALGLFAGSERVTRAEWRDFAEAIGIGKRLPGIQGIGYVVNTKRKDLALLAAEMKVNGAPDFTIPPLSQGQEYFIIKYVEPVDINGVSLGLNIAFHGARRAAAILSRDTGLAAVTQRITLLQDPDQAPGFILMLPHYKKGAPVTTEDERQKALLGWVYAPFVGRNFMSELTVSQGVDFNLTVYDSPDALPGDLLYSSGKQIRDAAYTVRKELDIKQQKWTFVWASTAGFEQKELSNEPLIILISGLLFTGLLGVLLMTQVQRTEVVERMVEMRTAELTEREAHLAQVVDKLTESNVELERFAYVVSHDMQEPVRMVANFSSLLWHQYQDRMDPAGQKYLGIISDGAKRLQAMIADLLEYARVGQGARGREMVDCKVLLQYVMENLNFLIYEHEAKVVQGELPAFQGYPVQVMSLFQNLINNAIKYQPKGARPVIHIAGEDRGDHILFSVRDNGLGIDAEHLEKIFDPFKRLHTYQEISGTGLGLSVCNIIVANHGGKIWVESTPGQGSTFYFTVMK